MADVNGSISPGGGAEDGTLTPQRSGTMQRAESSAAVVVEALQREALEGWCVDVAAIDAAASRLVEEAEAASPAMEARLKFLADTNRGKMVGLEYKIKQHASLARKMKSSWTSPSQTIDDVVDAQYDVLRFTMLLPAERYTGAVRQVLDELQRHEGCGVVSVKNYWGALTYRGINTILTTANGCKFELQFHTPQSFDQKQNKTHLVYEALRTEQDPMRQNLLYLDMVALWDAVATPERVDGVGTPRVQPAPTVGDVTDEQRAAITRIVEVKQHVRATLRPVMDSLRKIEPRVSALIEYCCATFNATLKNRDGKLRGSLNAQRKVEEDLRRQLRSTEMQSLHHLTFPADVKQRITALVEAQPDLLLFSIVFDNADGDEYARGVEGILDTCVAAKFELLHTDNHWACDEKHHPISAGFLVSTQHPIRRGNKGYALKFTIEFHTKASWEASLLRATVKTSIEEGMYRKGLPYKKSYVDTSLRFDPGLGEHWMEVTPPPGALAIGHSVDFDPSMSRPECQQHAARPWLPPDRAAAEAASRRRAYVAAALGLVIGGGAMLAGLIIGRQRPHASYPPALSLGKGGASPS